MKTITPESTAQEQTAVRRRSTTMKAVVKASPAPGVEIRDVPVPAVGPGEILLKILRAGVCGTDLHIWEWNDWAKGRMKTPVTVGHEFVGEIVETGAGVSELRVGDRVSCESHIVCGHCIACRTGNAHVCENTRILGVDVNGGWAEYVVVPEANAWRAPGNVPIEVQGIMEPLGNAVHTAYAGDLSACRIAVTGCGPIGLFAVGGARAAGAAQVIASDISPYRLELARKMNADAVIDPSRENFVERVHALTEGRMLDGVLEMSGNPTAIRDGLAALRMGGRLSLLALPSENFGLDWNKLLIFKGITMHGIIGRRMYQTWYQMDGLLRSGKAGKVVLVPWGQEN